MSTELEELRECYDILLKTARRCARDLAHCIDEVPVKSQIGLSRKEWRERQQHYDRVLGGTNDYRLHLYNRIERLERENENLRGDESDKQF